VKHYLFYKRVFSLGKAIKGICIFYFNILEGKKQMKSENKDDNKREDEKITLKHFYSMSSLKPDEKIRLTPTESELKFLYDIAFNTRVFLHAFELKFGDIGYQTFVEKMNDEQKFVDSLFEMVDFSKWEAGLLLHWGVLAYYLQQFVERMRIIIKDKIGFLDAYFGDRSECINHMNDSALSFNLIHHGGYFCQQEIQRRWGKERAIQSLIRLTSEDISSIEEEEHLEIVSESLRGLMRDKFVLSELHSSEHDREKEQLELTAISEEIDAIRQEREKDIFSLLRQMENILDGEKTQLSYAPRRIKNRFLNMVTAQVEGGKHWFTPESHKQFLEDQKTSWGIKHPMSWLDEEAENGRTKLEILSGEHEELQTTPYEYEEDALTPKQQEALKELLGKTGLKILEYRLQHPQIIGEHGEKKKIAQALGIAESTVGRYIGTKNRPGIFRVKAEEIKKIKKIIRGG